MSSPPSPSSTQGDRDEEGIASSGEEDAASTATGQDSVADNVTDSDDSDIVDLNNPRPPKPYVDFFFRHEQTSFLRSRLSRYQTEYIRGREEKTRVISEIYAQYCRLWPQDVERCPNFCYQSLRSRIAAWLNSRRDEQT